MNQELFDKITDGNLEIDEYTKYSGPIKHKFLIHFTGNRIMETDDYGVAKGFSQLGYLVEAYSLYKSKYIWLNNHKSDHKEKHGDDDKTINTNDEINDILTIDLDKLSPDNHKEHFSNQNYIDPSSHIKGDREEFSPWEAGTPVPPKKHKRRP